METLGYVQVLRNSIWKKAREPPIKICLANCCLIIKRPWHKLKVANMLHQNCMSDCLNGSQNPFLMLL